MYNLYDLCVLKNHRVPRTSVAVTKKIMRTNKWKKYYAVSTNMLHWIITQLGIKNSQVI